MSSRRWNEDETVHQGDNPVIEFTFLEEDDRTARNLAGYHGWVSWRYAGADVHVTRAGLVVGANGVLRYSCVGDEFTNVGEVLARATVEVKDLSDGVDRAYLSLSFPITRWRVIAKP